MFDAVFKNGELGYEDDIKRQINPKLNININKNFNHL